MQTLSRLFLRTDGSVESLKGLEEHADSMYKMTDSELTKLPKIGNPGVIVRVRESSIEIVIIIWTTAATLFSLISNYGSFRSGLRELINDARAVLEWVRTKIREQSRSEGTHVQNSRLTTGQLTQLNGILKKVERGEISSDDAQEMAIRVFERAGEKLPNESKAYLRRSFEEVPKGEKPPPPRPVRKPSKLYRRRYGQGFEIRRDPGADNVERRPIGSGER